jgi:urease accessory protein
MERDATAIRQGKPIVFTNLKTGDGLDRVIEWIRQDVLFETAQ